MSTFPGCVVALDRSSVDRLLSALPTGKNAAVSMAMVQRRLGIMNQRTAETARALVKYAIEEENELICTSSKGVWLPESVQEVLDYIASLQSRQQGIQNRIDGLKEGLAIHAGVAL